MVKDFRHACVVVKNLDKSLQFYRDILGLKVFKVFNIEGKYPESVLKVKGIKLTYVKMRTKGQPRNSPAVFELHYWKKPKVAKRARYNHISFTIENLDREYKRLSRRGVRFISKPMQAPHGKTKICFGYDPDNNLIEFVEESKK